MHAASRWENMLLWLLHIHQANVGVIFQCFEDLEKFEMNSPLAPAFWFLGHNGTSSDWCDCGWSGIADTIAAWILSMLGVYLLIRGSWAVILFWCPSRSPVTSKVRADGLRTVSTFAAVQLRCGTGQPASGRRFLGDPSSNGWESKTSSRSGAGAVSSERATSSSSSMLGFSHWFGFDNFGPMSHLQINNDKWLMNKNRSW